jgi:hypothetical protein
MHYVCAPFEESLHRLKLTALWRVCCVVAQVGMSAMNLRYDPILHDPNMRNEPGMGLVLLSGCICAA